MQPIFEKIGAEAVSFQVDMTGRLPASVLLAASGSTAVLYDKFGIDVSATILEAASPVVTTPLTNLVMFSCKAGAQPTGEYAGVLTLALASGGPLVEPFTLIVLPAHP